MDMPKKVAVIGLDCALTHLIDKHISEGHLPTFKKLFDEGTVAENCLAPFPTITPPNWAAIGTGARTGTHNIGDFWVHIPGTPLDHANCPQAYNSERSRAEYVWDALDKADKKCVVLNFPGSWPSHMQNGIMIGGSGLSVHEYRDGRKGFESWVDACHDQLITTGIYPAAIKGEFKDADGWTNVPEMGEDPLELEASLRFPGALKKPEPTTWYVLARQTGGKGYDQVTLSPTRDFSGVFCTLGVGEWSPRIVTNLKLQDGSEREVFFRCKLLELSDDAEDFRLFITAMAGTDGFSSPPEVAKEIVSENGTLAPGGGVVGYSVGWYDLDTYAEINDQYCEWMADAATALLTKHDWDGFFMHSHPTDWIYHVVMTDMDPDLTKDEAKRKEAWDAHLKIYQSTDRMLAKILEALGEDTVVILISDHGATPDGPAFNPYNALTPAGLAVLEAEQDTRTSETGRMQGLLEELKILRQKPDPKKSKAIALQSGYIYINLKGRDPDGIVDPEDYEKVQRQIIDALYTYVDPDTGKRPVVLALSKQDARILGLYGDGVGDVIFAIYPYFGMQHGALLPTAEWGVGTLRTLFTLHGPGIKKGYRLQRTVSLIDLVPTICYLMNWPVPGQAEGNVIYQAFEDPNFKMKQAIELRESLAKMEAALAQGTEET